MLVLGDLHLLLAIDDLEEFIEREQLDLRLLL